MVRHVLDTDVCIYLLKGEAEAVSYFQEAQQEALLFSVISRAELLSYPELTDTDREHINALFASGLVVDVDETIAEEAARIRRELRRQGKRMPHLPDALVAATAITEDATLVTNNLDDFIKRAVKPLALAMGISPYFGVCVGISSYRQS